MARATQRPDRVGSPRSLGTGRCRDVAKGNGTLDGQGDRKRQATALWERETSCHGVVNHGLTMGNLTTGSRENALNSGTAIEVSAGVRVDLEIPWVNGLSTRGFTRERDQGKRGKGRPLASSRGWLTPKCIQEPSGYSNP